MRKSSKKALMAAILLAAGPSRLLAQKEIREDLSSVTDLRKEGQVDEVLYQPVELELHQTWWNLPADKENSRIGLTSFDYRIYQTPRLNWAFGFFVTTFGQYGGFNGLFLDLGYRFPLTQKLALKTQVAVGGAGGVGVSSAGGGLFVNPSTALNLGLSPTVSADVGASYVHFPNGEIRSFQPKAGISFAGDFLFVEKRALYPSESAPVSSEDPWPLEKKRWRLAPTFKLMFPVGGSRASTAVGGKSKWLERIDVAGLSVSHFTSEHWFTQAEILGAFGGGVGGYLSFGGGGGYLHPLSKKLTLAPKLTVGGAGGGRVPIGGGLFAEPSAQIILGLQKEASLHAGVGYFHPFTGVSSGFRAMTVDFGVGTQFDVAYIAEDKVKSGRKPERKLISARHDAMDFAFRGGFENYFIAEERGLRGGPNLDVKLMSLGLEALFSSLAVSGVGSWPLMGEAAGYASGTLGVRLKLFQVKATPVSFGAKFGSAAGGGLPVGKGLLLAPYLHAKTLIGERMSVFGEFNRNRFLEGASFWSFQLGIAREISFLSD